LKSWAEAMEMLIRRTVNTARRRPEAVIGFLLQGQRTAGKVTSLTQYSHIGLAALLCYGSRTILAGTTLLSPEN
jgi:hypothetical protein